MDLDDDDDDDEADIDEEDLHSRDLLITICAGIVTVDKDSNVMRLVHYTAQEYFLRHRGEIFPTAVVEIPSACLKYLSLSPFEKGYCRNNEDMATRLKNYSLLRYAAEEWGNHARGKPEGILKDEIIEYLSNENLRGCWSQLESLPKLHYGDWSLQFARIDRPLVIAAYFGLAEIIKLLIDNGADVNNEDFNMPTPLVVAASQGHEDAVKLLLGRGAKVTAKCGRKNMKSYTLDSHGTTALHEAARNGQDNVIKILLEHGADVQALGTDNETATKCAVVQGHIESTKILLKHVRQFLNLTIAAEHTGQCLIDAAETGNEGITRALLEVDPHAGKLIPWGQSALQAAAAKAYPAIVTQLLDSGAEINHSHSHYYVFGSVLQAACTNGNLSLVKDLLAKGADVNSHGGSEGNPLQAAAAWVSTDSPKDGKETRLAVVKLLLEKGADINARGGAYGTALQGAAAQANEEIVKLLLEKGADVNLRYGPFGTALQAATRRKFENIVRLLIEHKAEVNHQAKALLENIFPGIDFFAKKRKRLRFKMPSDLFITPSVMRVKSLRSVGLLGRLSRRL